MEKVSFALDVEDGWPPVAVEHVWCERHDDLYKLVNAPFFIQGLAYGDKFTAVPDSVNGCVFEFTVVEPSGHSLVWVLDTETHAFGPVKHEVLKLGCRVEGFPVFGLHSIDVPLSVDVTMLNDSVASLEARGFSLAFPVWRHELHAA